MLPNIGLMGYAGAGKDTVADYLVRTYQYTRVAFADPLKEMALSINPLMDSACCSGCESPSDSEDYYLADAVREHGWESAKRNVPEVRRFLRSLGATMRDRDPDYWLDIALRKIIAAENLGMPVVITDVRHENEFESLRNYYDFTMVRIDRPGTDTSDVDPESGRLIESVVPDTTLQNGLTIENLHSQIDALVGYLELH